METIADLRIELNMIEREISFSRGAPYFKALIKRRRKIRKTIEKLQAREASNGSQE